MQEEHFHRYDNTPFSVICTSIENSPGTWNSTKVTIYYDDQFDVKAGVYRTGVVIGEYIRNYANYGALTFCPFRIGNEWYALYSTHYTATRVMKLHEDRIEDWCGEEPRGAGFCPVEFYIPHYFQSKSSYIDGNGKLEEYDYYMVDCDISTAEIEEVVSDPEYVSEGYSNFGFLCGCIWGDDTSWKIKYINLSKIPEKILDITEKFGYWPMPNNATLKECVNMDGWDPDSGYIKLTKSEIIYLD